MIASGNTFFFPWETQLMEWLQANIGGTGISVISFFSAFGEELLLVLILGFVYWSFDKKLGRTMGLSAIIGMTWGPMIKNIALRRRPYFDNKGIKILRVVDPEADIYDIAAQGYSFPSGHSTNAAAVYGSLAVNLRKKWMTALAVILPVLTGVSRFVVGAHYPTDVLGGWLLGLLCVMIIQVLQKKVKKLPVLYGILLITAIPGFFFCRSTDYFSAVGLLLGFMGGTLLEERYVHFENTRKPVWMAVRVIGGLAVYVALNTALKLPFPKDFLSENSTASLLVRCGRYAIVSFVSFGVYPMLFRLEKKRG